ncbi:MAG: FUSC family protein [Acidobacteriota bacterium]|nr:FUSC family protein [Acidobacteriota bacterium]
MARALHWRRGLRAGFAVASAMLACQLLGKPMGWAALGGFEAVLVDNGGPYRSRLQTVAAVLLGGAACGLVGSLIPSAGSAAPGLAIAVAVTAAVCFAVTFARVASQTIASTSVIILVLYFAGFGSSGRTLHQAAGNVLAYVLGGVWAAGVSFVFWPVDPFRPARLAIAEAYELLGAFSATLHTATPAVRDQDQARATGFKRQLRSKLESARAALAATPARMPARTVRARNLSVLLETADMLFATTVRAGELAAGRLAGDAAERLEELARWLCGAERAIGAGLRERPADGGSSYGPEGSHRLEQITRRTQAVEHRRPDGYGDTEVLRRLAADERDSLQNVEIAFEAVRAVWSGVDSGAGRRPSMLPAERLATEKASWRDAVVQNWTLDSVMMRHALRMSVVGAADVLLMRTVHVTHGFWLAMTSIIVLQPYSSGTLRKSLQRVGGTVGGGVLAALLVAVIHSYAGMVVVITACSVLTLATYAVDYGWYSFFLTPTFVLMSLPYLRDWQYAGVRMVTTLLGAATALVAMRLLWPQSLRVELGGLLARLARAGEAYLRAALAFWETPPDERPAAERQILASARRACGLSSQDAEEALDRAMLERLPVAFSRGRRPSAVNESALTFTTYMRRFTQCLTVLAAEASPDARTIRRVGTLAVRLETIARNLSGVRTPGDAGEARKPSRDQDGNDAEIGRGGPAASLPEQMLQRMERQAGVLERAAKAMTADAQPR